MGRYVQAIELGNGEIIFIELKSSKLTDKQLEDAIFGEGGLLERQKITLKNNFQKV